MSATAVAPEAAGTFRQAVQSAARRFKSTWVELGKLLVRVQGEQLYETWGYPTFEAYCFKELHIRRSTALKLTRSFSFLARHEPDAVKDERLPERAPAFEVVEVLADAEGRGQLSPREYQEVRESIWNPDRPVGELRRELGERFPRPAPTPDEGAELGRLAGAARRLAQELAKSPKIPRAVAERALALAEEVGALARKVKPDA